MSDIYNSPSVAKASTTMQLSRILASELSFSYHVLTPKLVQAVADHLRLLHLPIYALHDRDMIVGAGTTEAARDWSTCAWMTRHASRCPHAQFNATTDVSEYPVSFEAARSLILALAPHLAQFQLVAYKTEKDQFVCIGYVYVSDSS